MPSICTEIYFINGETRDAHLVSKAERNQKQQRQTHTNGSRDTTAPLAVGRTRGQIRQGRVTRDIRSVDVRDGYSLLISILVLYGNLVAFLQVDTWRYRPLTILVGINSLGSLLTVLIRHSDEYFGAQLSSTSDFLVTFSAPINGRLNDVDRTNDLRTNSSGLLVPVMVSDGKLISLLDRVNGRFGGLFTGVVIREVVLIGWVSAGLDLVTIVDAGTIGISLERNSYARAP